MRTRTRALLLLLGLLLFASRQGFCQVEESLYADFFGRLRRLEALLASRPDPLPQEIEELEQLRAELADSSYPALLERCETLLALVRTRARVESESADSGSLVLLAEAQERRRRARRLRVTRRVSLGAAILSLGLFNTFWYLSDKTYNDYIDAGATDRDLKRRITLYDSLTIGFGAAALAGAGLSVGVLIVEQRRGDGR
jgi:hypothetical protein